MLPDDDSVSLPTPPPPRPASREAAIGAALRRFDGIEDRPSVSKPARWTWNRHPQLGFALAASLIVAIGLPAAFIALRDQGASPVGVSATSPPTAQPRRAVVPSSSIPEAAPEPGPVKRRAVAPPGAPPVRLQREEAKASPVAEAQAAPSADMAYAAAPPPPPPALPRPPPPAAEKVASTGDLVVTGTRIPRPNLSAQSSPMNREASGIAAERDEVANDLPAPDWVLKNPAYRTFLTKLQNALRVNDRDAVIKLAGLPLRVNYSRSHIYRDAKSVRADYDRIFTPNVRTVILAQRFEQLFGRDQGVMIGDGEVWFDHACLNSSCSRRGPVRIIAINPR
jgi:hypothetical protein